MEDGDDDASACIKYPTRPASLCALPNPFLPPKVKGVSSFRPNAPHAWLLCLRARPHTAHQPTMPMMVYLACICGGVQGTANVAHPSRHAGPSLTPSRGGGNTTTDKQCGYMLAKGYACKYILTRLPAVVWRRVVPLSGAPLDLSMWMNRRPWYIPIAWQGVRRFMMALTHE